MRRTGTQTDKKPSPTASPFIPSSSDSSHDAIASSSSSTPTKYIPTGRVNLPPGQIPCKFYMKGYCSRGSVCWYKHDASSVPIPIIVEDGGKKTVIEVREPKGKEKVAVGSQDSELGVADDLEPCAICFDSPTTYGLLTNCDHVFCLSCIRSWRSSGNRNENAPSPLSPFAAPDEGNLNKTSKTCPLCRIRSKFIIPSSIFPTPPPGPKSTENDLSSNPAKEAIVQRYLDKLGTIPCRYFQDSMTRPGVCRGMRNLGNRRNEPMVPFCPFGNECHYAHLQASGEKYVFTDRELSNHRRSRAPRSGRNRNRAVERMLVGIYNNTHGRHHGFLRGNGPGAQDILTLLMENGAPNWDVGYPHFRARDEDEDDDDDEEEEEDVWADAEDVLDMADLLDVLSARPARESFYHGGVFENGRFNDQPRGGGREESFTLGGRRRGRDPIVPDLVNIDDLD